MKVAIAPLSPWSSDNSAISAPGSKSSADTSSLTGAISASGDGREEGHLVGGRHRRVHRGVILIDGGHQARRRQSLGVLRAESFQPLDQLSDGGDFGRRRDAFLA